MCCVFALLLLSLRFSIVWSVLFALFSVDKVFIMCPLIDISGKKNLLLCLQKNENCMKIVPVYLNSGFLGFFLQINNKNEDKKNETYDL